MPSVRAALLFKLTTRKSRRLPEETHKVILYSSSMRVWKAFASLAVSGSILQVILHFWSSRICICRASQSPLRQRTGDKKI